MFGKEFYQNPEILLDSFGEMNDAYEDVSDKNRRVNMLKILESYYIRIFGIPEIGFQIRFLYLESFLKNTIKRNPKKILDAGSGIGSQSLWLSGRYKHAEIVGYDIDNNKLKQAKIFVKKIRNQRIQFFYEDISKSLKEKNTYDLIVNIDVLEHIVNYKAVLKNFYKLLQVGGHVYIHTPQPDQKRIFKQFEKWHHEDHVREGYEPQLLIKELKKCGFVIVEKKETFGFFGKFAWELNHLSLSKSFVLTGLIFPLLYILARFDLFTENKNGLGTAILAKKV